jgi:asparagine synthase (glutamine-hydrolysing)
MCGIAGALDLSGSPIEPALVQRMTRSLSHRGPDDEGYWHNGATALGHRRLSILDLGGGHQPMGNEAGDVVVVFNGEVYNFAELRAELEARGHRFRSRSDTEVIPHAHEEWGDAAVERMRGMFAYAIWDARRRRLTLARDRLGVKPLYWARAGDRLLFASELKALLAGGAIERRLDLEALHDYLTLLVPLAPRTLFAGVSQLEPGTVLTVADGRLSLRRYWEPAITPDPHLGEARALAELEDRLREVLRDQVVADVPVGAFLSGGIDSSLLVSFLAEERLEPLDTFTVGFDDRSVDEAPFARAVADRFRTRHHELRVAAGAAGHALVSRVLDQFDQPFGDSSAIPTWLVSRETRRFVKTVISGDGGDELFGGYLAYRVASQLGTLRRLPEAARSALGVTASLLAGVPVGGAREAGRRLGKALAIAAMSPGEALCALRSYFDEPAKAALYRPEIARRISGYRTAERFAIPSVSGDLATDLAACDLRHRLAGDMLCKVDMMSMSHGLEVRVPLLDERIVDLALRLPPDLRLRGRTTKYLLRRAARRRLPRLVANKPKGGFVIPLRRAAGDGLDQLLSETLGAPRPRVAAVFRMDVVKEYAEAFSSDRPPQGGMSRWQLDQRVYALAALERWMVKWEVTV